MKTNKLISRNPILRFKEGKAIQYIADGGHPFIGKNSNRWDLRSNAGELKLGNDNFLYGKYNGRYYQINPNTGALLNGGDDNTYKTSFENGRAYTRPTTGSTGSNLPGVSGNDWALNWRNFTSDSDGSNYQRIRNALKEYGKYSDATINDIFSSAGNFQLFMNAFGNANQWSKVGSLKVDNKYGNLTNASMEQLFNAVTNLDNRSRIKWDFLWGSNPSSITSTATTNNGVTRTPYKAKGNYGRRLFKSLGIRDFDTLRAAALNSRYANNYFIQDMIGAFGNPEYWDKNTIENALGLKNRYGTTWFGDLSDAMRNLQTYIDTVKPDNVSVVGENERNRNMENIRTALLNWRSPLYRDFNGNINTDGFNVTSLKLKLGGHLISRDPVERFKLGNKILYALHGVGAAGKVLAETVLAKTGKAGERTIPRKMWDYISRLWTKRSVSPGEYEYARQVATLEELNRLAEESAERYGKLNKKRKTKTGLSTKEKDELKKLSALKTARNKATTYHEGAMSRIEQPKNWDKVSEKAMKAVEEGNPYERLFSWGRVGRTAGRTAGILGTGLGLYGLGSYYLNDSNSPTTNNSTYYIGSVPISENMGMFMPDGVDTGMLGYRTSGPNDTYTNFYRYALKNQRSNGDFSFDMTNDGDIITLRGPSFDERARHYGFDSANDVIKWQEFLNSQFPPNMQIPVDGKFGIKTEAATLDYLQYAAKNGKLNNNSKLAPYITKLDRT